MAIQFDFASIKSRLESSLRSKEAWKRLLFFSTNTRLLDSEAEEVAQLAYYREKLQMELFWGKANNITSLNEQSKLVGYYPYRKIGASGVLKVSTGQNFDEIHPFDVYIPKDTVFLSTGGVKLATTESYILGNIETYIEIDVIQGIPQSYTYIAQGNTLENFEILSDSIENYNITVEVNGIPYEIVNNVYEYLSDDLVVEIRNKTDFSGVSIRFGDNITGKKLELNDTVKVYYYETLGSNGNILSSDEVTNVESLIYDSENTKVTLYVTNEEAIIGGSDVEDKESIRVNAPKFNQTGGRIVHKEDYEYIVNSNSAVLKSLVWGEYEINQDLGKSIWDFLELEENNVNIVAISTLGDSLTDNQKETIFYEILPLKPPTDHIKFYNPDIIYLIFNTNAFTTNRSIKISDLKATINATLSNTYSITSLDFFENIYFSDYQALIDNVENVKYHDTTVDLFSLKYFEDAYVAGFELGLYPILEESISVYIRDTTTSDPFVLIGTDDGAGNFDAEVGYDLTGSTVSYVDGSGIIQVVSGLSESFADYEIKIKFDLTTENLLLKQRYQIFQYSEDDSVINAYYT